MKLKDQIEPESYDTAFWMAGIYDPEFPFKNMGELASEVCRKLRTLAISVLCANANLITFQHNLIRSGRVREQYLRRCISENHLLDHHRSAGWYSALMDALAAGDLGLAGSIAKLTPEDFRPGHEYEDDFCYVQLIHNLIGSGTKESRLLLEEFETYLEGEPNTRLSLMQSLLPGDQSGFEKAFEELLQDHERAIAAEIARGRFEDIHVNADRRIFVEGLAILRLAEMRGLTTQYEYLFCPSIARQPLAETFPGE